MPYLARIVDASIADALAFAGALLLEGPRACGKSETGRHHAASTVRIDVDDEARRRAAVAPERLLEGPTPRFIDEWQLEPELWNHVRAQVDERGTPGQFLLAGSAVPADDATRHSGAGRILRVRMRPMSLHESGASSGHVSLAAIADGTATVDGTSDLTVDDLADWLCRGGWPGLRALTPRQAQRLLVSYLDDVARADVPRLDGERRRDPARLLRTMRSFARHVGTEASMSTIAADVAVDDAPMRHETVAEYLHALERVFVVEDQPPWAPHLRSRDRLRKASKRHFVDPSLAVAALGSSPGGLLDDLELMGLLFESMVVRDLRVYAQALDAEVRHVRDARGREADAVIVFRDGSWIAVEVKLAARREDEAAASLETIANAVDTARTGRMRARVIVTGGRHAYTRHDGIHVVPLGALAP